MNDADMTKAQLLAEINMLRQRNTELEAAARAQRQTEAELRERVERHRTLIEGSLQGISVFNLARIIHKIAISLNKSLF